MINPQKPHIYRQQGRWQVEKSEPSVTTLFAHMIILHNTNIIKATYESANQEAEKFVKRLNQK